MNRYAKGRLAEYKAIEYLKQLGSSYVVRSTGSHGLIDLIAFFPKEKKIQLIQVKKLKRKVSEDYLKKEYSELKDFNGLWSVEALILTKEKRGFKTIKF